MLEINSVLLYQLINIHILPTIRILGIFTSAPVFSNRNITASVRIAMGVLISIIITPSLNPPEIDLLGWTGLLAIIEEFMVGIAMGFSMRLVFTAVEMTGEIISLTMGLGFATFFDPQSQGHTASISQFFSALLILIFIGADFHLLFLESLVTSFNTIPLNTGGLGHMEFLSIAQNGALIFTIGVKLAIPIITALLVMTITLGVLTKAAPQLNLFGIGFPITLLTGFVMMYLILLYWSLPLADTVRLGLSMIDHLIGN